MTTRELIAKLEKFNGGAIVTITTRENLKYTTDLADRELEVLQMDLLDKFNNKEEFCVIVED
jgi:hypothetical protein